MADRVLGVVAGRAPRLALPKLPLICPHVGLAALGQSVTPLTVLRASKNRAKLSTLNGRGLRTFGDAPDCPKGFQKSR